MKKQDSSKRPTPPKPNQESDPEGYPLYPENEDIYTKLKEEQDIDPEDLSRRKERIPLEDDSLLDPDEFEDDIMGSDLDVPGSELDDENEDIGNEDEENNYYSIGGDNHNDLEEDHGDDE